MKHFLLIHLHTFRALISADCSVYAAIHLHSKSALLNLLCQHQGRKAALNKRSWKRSHFQWIILPRPPCWHHVAQPDIFFPSLVNLYPRIWGENICHETGGTLQSTKTHPLCSAVTSEQRGVLWEFASKRRRVSGVDATGGFLHGLWRYACFKHSIQVFSMNTRFNRIMALVKELEFFIFRDVRHSACVVLLYEDLAVLLFFIIY